MRNYHLQAGLRIQGANWQQAFREVWCRTHQAASLMQANPPYELMPGRHEVPQPIQLTTNSIDVHNSQIPRSHSCKAFIGALQYKCSLFV
jgi:hypothetical protein